MEKRRNFKTQKVYISNDGTKPMLFCKVQKWEWNASDLLWYHEDTDESWYMERPKNGQKAYSLKAGYHARLLVKDC
ncbi:MAG: hypothetical protein J6T10_00830 [Methanobrevibacter sp.]|nr:hypothetical protein [Methanobrevibacter sp.]